MISRTNSGVLSVAIDTTVPPRVAFCVLSVSATPDRSKARIDLVTMHPSVIAYDDDIRRILSVSSLPILIFFIVSSGVKRGRPEIRPPGISANADHSVYSCKLKRGRERSDPSDYSSVWRLVNRLLPIFVATYRKSAENESVGNEYSSIDSIW